METKGFFQFESIINVLVSSFCFIWIPMLGVYGHYKYFTLSVRGSTLDVRIWRGRQILTSKFNPHAERDKVTTGFDDLSWIISLLYFSRLYYASWPQESFPRAPVEILYIYIQTAIYRDTVYSGLDINMLRQYAESDVEQYSLTIHIFYLATV